jgi:putative transposase
VYPYLLRDVTITRPNQVWCTEITCEPMRRGFLYLVAMMDWFSRFVLSWELSSTLDGSFCSTALDCAFTHGKPEIPQLRSGCAVQLDRVHRSPSATADPDQHR